MSQSRKGCFRNPRYTQLPVSSINSIFGIVDTLWGTIGLFSTLLSKLGMDSSAVAFYRLLSASVLLIPILLVKGKGVSLFSISKKGLISCALIGFISQAFYNLCYMKAIELGGMATAAVLLYTSPVFVAIMSRALFKEPLGKNKLAAITINIIGCVLTVTGGDFSTVKLTGFALMMGVLAGFTYGTMPIFSRFGADNEDPYTSSFYGLALGALFLFLLVRPYNGMGTEWNWQILLVLIGFGIVPSALAYILYFGGLSKIKETSVVPVLASIETVAASVIGLVVFGQSLSLGKVVGIALVVTDLTVFLMNMLYEGRLDFVIGINPPVMKGLVSEEIFDDKVCLAVPVHIAEEHSGADSEVDIRDYQDIPFIRDLNESSTGIMIDRFLAKNNISINTIINANDYHEQAELCCILDVAMFCSKTFIYSATRSSVREQLKLLDVRGLNQPMTICLIKSERRVYPKCVTDMIEVTRDVLYTFYKNNIAKK